MIARSVMITRGSPLARLPLVPATPLVSATPTGAAAAGVARTDSGGNRLDRPGAASGRRHRSQGHFTQGRFIQGRFTRRGDLRLPS